MSTRFPEYINIVSISLPEIPEEQTVYITTTEKNYPHEHRILGYKTQFKKLLHREFRETLNYAVQEFKADVICINELGMPLNKNGVADQKAINFARKIANENDCLIVAGTNHTKNGFLNVGYVFYPGLDRDGNDYKCFYKHISAVQVNERLFTPSERIIPYTRAFGLGFSFLICLEIADFSSTATIVKMKDIIDFLIVPSYLEDYGTMAKVAKKISEPLGGVLLNNCFLNEDQAKSILYLNGEVHPKYRGERRKSFPNEDDTNTRNIKITTRTVNIEEFKKNQK